MNPKQGEAWLADLGLAAKTTTQNRQSRYEAAIPRLPFLRDGTVANAEGLGSLPFVRLEHKPGVLPAGAIDEIKQAAAFALGLVD